MTGRGSRQDQPVAAGCDAAAAMTVTERIACALAQAESDITDAAICRNLEICADTLVGWKCRYAGLRISAMRHLRELEAENRRLRQQVADLNLYKAMLQDALRNGGGP